MKQHRKPRNRSKRTQTALELVEEAVPVENNGTVRGLDGLRGGRHPGGGVEIPW